MLAAIGDDPCLRTTNYVGKDIVGQTLGLVGAAALTNSKKVDIHPEKCVFASNLLQQSSYIIMCATPLVAPDCFLVVAGSANALMNVSCIGLGAVNAKCIQRLATDDNVAELYSKVTVANTLSASIGMAGGVLLSTAGLPWSQQMALVTLLGAARIYTLDRAVRCVLHDKSP
jgi:hypothetical protein